MVVLDQNFEGLVDWSHVGIKDMLGGGWDSLSEETEWHILKRGTVRFSWGVVHVECGGNR